MPKDLVARHRRLIDFLNESRERGEAVALEMLELPPEEWEAWFDDHPEARSFGTLEALCHHAEERRRTDGLPALPVTDFVTRHVDTVAMPPDMDGLRVCLRFDAWQAHARALRCSRRLDEALRAYETAAAIARAEMPIERELLEIEYELKGFLDIPTDFPRPPVTQADIRRVEELVEQYGWHHLRDKG